jgi:hypothetical protein
VENIEKRTKRPFSEIVVLAQLQVSDVARKKKCI